MNQKEWIEIALKYSGDCCLEWPWSLSKGYPHHSSSQQVHVIITTRAHGPKPFPNAQAAHSCHNSKCCTKRHLRWLTPSENQQESLSTTKLTREEVIEIRTSNLTQTKLAQIYNISQQHISGIRNNKKRKSG